MSIVKEFSVDKLNIKIFRTRNHMGKTAGEMIGSKLKELLNEKDEVNVIFAAAPSQNETLEALLDVTGIDWSRVNAFHMDEYIGLSKDAPQGFGNFLRDKIFSKVNFKTINYINGQAENPLEECDRYSELLRQYPVDIVCMGIGENGHIAFNDPWVADFSDEKTVKVVELDMICRQQQVNDGCFISLENVPTHALTLTIPALLKASAIFCVVPASTKCNAVYNTVRGEISTACPASILRKHDNATLYCDVDSGKKILFRKAVITDEISQDFEIAVALAAKYGLEAVELRSAWDKGPHQLNYHDIEHIKDIISKYNMKVCAVSSPVFKCDIDDTDAVAQQYEILDKCIMVAKELNAKFIRGFTFWRKNGFEQNMDIIVQHVENAASILLKNGLVFAVENDPAVNAADAAELNELLSKVKANNVTAMWDPGNQVYNDKFGISYPDGYNILKKKVGHVHIKDAVIDENGKAVGVVVGEGLVDFEGQLKALLDDGYDGYIVLEPHFRIKGKLDESLLALPGGSNFSEGGYEASELSMQRLDEIISRIIC